MDLKYSSNSSMKPWYKKYRVLIATKTTTRPPLANINLLSDYWKEVFSNIAEQKEPAIHLLEGENVEVDIDGIVWTSFTKYHLDHHEYSEQRVIQERMGCRPTIQECLDGPRLAAGKSYRWLKRFIKRAKREVISDSCSVLYFSDNRAQGNFYHWMIDSLSRLLIAKPSLKESYLLLSEEQVKKEYVIESLSLLGINKDKLLPIKKGVRYQVKNLQVISCSIFATGACSSNGVKLVQECLSIPANEPDEFVYIARKPAFGRRIINASEFNQVLNKFGIQTIYPEDVSFESLRNLLGNTKVLLGVYSASLTHAIFLAKGGHVIELASNKFITSTPTYWGDNYDSELSGDYYYSLSSACGLNHHLIPCAQDDESEYALQADIFVDVGLLEKTILQIIKQ